MNTRTRTKQELIEMLSSALTTDKALQERIDYTLQKCNENLRSVSKTDLVALYKEVQATKQQVVETAKKKTVKKTAKKVSAKETPKETSKEVVDMENLATSKMFPNTINLKDFGKFKLSHSIKSFEDLRTQIENGKELIFCFYWSKRLLKQFPYSNLVQAPESFDNDLDVTTPLYISDDGIISYTLSMYTESIYAIKEEDLQEVDSIRFASGIEYQIYVKVA